MSLRDVQKTGGRRSFGRGFRQRSPLVLVAAALLTAAVLLGGQALLFDGGLTAVDEGRLLRITHDDYVHVSVRVQELRKDPPTTRTVYLFGGSGTMECFISEASLASAISREAGQAGAGREPRRAPGEHGDVPGADRQPAARAGHARARPRAHPRHRRARARRRDAERPHAAGAQPAPRGPGAALPRQRRRRPRARSPASSTTSARTSRSGPPRSALWGTPIIYETHYYPWGAKGHLPLGKRRNVLYVLEKDVELYRKYADYNFAMLEEILKLADERGFDVVLYDQPLNASAAGPDWNGVVPAYRKRARELAARYDVPYVHIERGVKLSDDDFADLFHLLAPAPAQVAAGDGAAAGRRAGRVARAGRGGAVRGAPGGSAAMTPDGLPAGAQTPPGPRPG